MVVIVVVIHVPCSCSPNHSISYCTYMLIALIYFSKAFLAGHFELLNCNITEIVKIANAFYNIK